MANELQGPEPKMDATNLYREEIITDRRVGTIRLLTPISPSGAVDSKRKVLYVGETQVLTAGGSPSLPFVPCTGPPSQAIAKISACGHRPVGGTIPEITKPRRQARSAAATPHMRNAPSALPR